MSGVKHTPGKWMAAAKPSSIVGWPVVAAPMGQVICDVAIINKKPDHVSDGEFSAYYAQVEANARLIAAAPDLLKAGQNVVEEWGMRTGDDDALLPSSEQPESIAALMRAIARARGES